MHKGELMEFGAVESELKHELTSLFQHFRAYLAG